MKTQLRYLTILFVAIAAFTFSASAQTKAPAKAVTEIHFIEDAWTTALKQATAQNKYILVDAYATWCGPCKMLRSTTFKDGKVAAFYNKNFINVSIDMEKGAGPQLASQWQIEAYPTLIIFNAKGKAVLQSVGYIQAADMLKFGQQALAKKI